MNKEILDAYGLPESGIFESNGKQYLADRLGQARNGDFYLFGKDFSRLTKSSSDHTNVTSLIVKELAIPPKPTPEQWATLQAKYPNYDLVLGEMPDMTSAPWLSECCMFITGNAPPSDARFKKLRYPVTMTEKPVKRWVLWRDRLIAAFVGDRPIEIIGTDGKKRDIEGSSGYSKGWTDRGDKLISETEYLRIRSQWAVPEVVYWQSRYAPECIYKCLDGKIVEHSRGPHNIGYALAPSNHMHANRITKERYEAIKNKKPLTLGDLQPGDIVLLADGTPDVVLERGTKLSSGKVLSDSTQIKGWNSTVGILTGKSWLTSK